MLLPPSEGKSVPRRGAPYDPERLLYPALAPHRRAVAEALAALSSCPEAAEVLKVGATVADDVARNATLLASPARPAREVYTGVLFAAAGLDRLTRVQAERAERTVRIFSGLWGVVRPGDPIPAYRLSMGVTLPGVGPLAAAWLPHLAPLLDEAARGDVVVDCRSTTYVGAWRPRPGTDWVSVAVLRERGGERTVVSHHAKHLRGVLVRHLLTRRGKEPASAAAVLRATRELVGTSVSGEPVVAVELEAGARGRSTLAIVTA
jgi:cytoplasmic iron level regulating protein YaaA (DUF328/UPF0246 family)